MFRLVFFKIVVAVFLQPGADFLSGFRCSGAVIAKTLVSGLYQLVSTVLPSHAFSF